MFLFVCLFVIVFVADVGVLVAAVVAFAGVLVFIVYHAHVIGPKTMFIRAIGDPPVPLPPPLAQRIAASLNVTQSLRRTF